MNKNQAETISNYRRALLLERSVQIRATNSKMSVGSVDSKGYQPELTRTQFQHLSGGHHCHSKRTRKVFMREAIEPSLLDNGVVPRESPPTVSPTSSFITSTGAVTCPLSLSNLLSYFQGSPGSGRWRVWNAFERQCVS
ncbi:Hypothetical predicted protein [Podarcis lilfordi]|uniref:Uncharacterized protein n=1 Tax=Podarcis lilfordi TaxID=74358 RepID=A0AA35PHB7_9SAUR|nr:Hypothetical predicted protein [Podarcis lilfordi]